MTTATQWRMKGSIICACSCDWGCPCNFNARPTYGSCEGTYIWQVEAGHYEDVSLDGLVMSWSGESPGPVHEGHITTQVVIDSRANDQQREAILRLFKGEDGGPFAIFAAVTRQGWRMRELRRDDQTLEQIFRELTEAPASEVTA